MSSVLIGIIGVILFIGLALAGVLILGSDFVTASNTSRAATYMSQVNQVSHAVNMYEMKLGVRAPTTTDLSFLSPRFLKTVPPGYRITRWGSGNTVAYLIIADNARNRQVCEEIQRQVGIISDSQPFYSDSSTIQSMIDSHPVGCRVWTGTNQLAIWSGV